MKESLVKLEGITKSYDGQMILDDLNLDIYKGEFISNTILNAKSFKKMIK